MPLPSSGNPISFSQLQAEFGDTGPASLSEFYRGGILVPGSGDVTTNTWEVQSTVGPLGPDSDNHLAYYGVGQLGIVRVNSSIVSYINFTSGIFVPSSVVDPEPSPNVPNGTDIEAFWTSPSSSPLPNAPEDDALTWYATGYNIWGYTTSTGTGSFNQNVPTSGAISLSNLFGATDV